MKYAVSVVIYSYVEVEADSIPNANSKAYCGDFIRMINPEVAEVFDENDGTGQTVPLLTWSEKNECVCGFSDDLAAKEEELAAQIMTNQLREEDAIAELGALGYSESDAKYVLNGRIREH